jgi:hypothetical protein
MVNFNLKFDFLNRKNKDDEYPNLEKIVQDKKSMNSYCKKNKDICKLLDSLLSSKNQTISMEKLTNEEIEKLLKVLLINHIKIKKVLNYYVTKFKSLFSENPLYFTEQFLLITKENTKEIRVNTDVLEITLRLKGQYDFISQFKKIDYDISVKVLNLKGMLFVLNKEDKIEKIKDLLEKQFQLELQEIEKRKPLLDSLYFLLKEEMLKPLYFIYFITPFHLKFLTEKGGEVSFSFNKREVILEVTGKQQLFKFDLERQIINILTSDYQRSIDLNKEDVKKLKEGIKQRLIEYVESLF